MSDIFSTPVQIHATELHIATKITLNNQFPLTTLSCTAFNFCFRAICSSIPQKNHDRSNQQKKQQDKTEQNNIG